MKHILKLVIVLAVVFTSQNLQASPMAFVNQQDNTHTHQIQRVSGNVDKMNIYAGRVHRKKHFLKSLVQCKETKHPVNKIGRLAFFIILGGIVLFFVFPSSLSLLAIPVSAILGIISLIKSQKTEENNLLGMLALILSGLSLFLFLKTFSAG